MHLTSTAPRRAIRSGSLSFTVLAVIASVLLSACGSGSTQGQETAPTESNGSGSSPTATGSATDSGEMPTITLGGVQPLTGAAAGIGQRMSNGARLAMDELREEGVVDIEYVEEDAGADNAAALNAMRRVLRSEPQAILGPFLGTMNLALRPEIERAEIPMLVASGTRSITQNDNEWLFRFAPHDGIAKRAQATFAVEELGLERPAIVHDSTEYGQLGADLMTETLESLGSPPVAREVMNADDRDASGQVLRIGDADPDGILVQLIGGATGAVLIKEIRSAGLDIPIVWNSGFTSEALLDLVTEAEAEGVYVESPMVPPTESDDPDVRAFAEKFQERFDMEADTFAVYMYDAVHMLGEAVRSGATTPPEFREALATLTYDGIGTTYEADEELTMWHEAVILQRTDGGFEAQ